MLSQHYIDMTSQKSAIRELFDYGSRRAKEIGYENVFDYSLVIQAYLLHRNLQMHY